MSGDKTLVGIASGLSLFGLMMIYSASGVLAERVHGDTGFFFKRQCLWLVLAFGVFVIVSRMDMADLRHFMAPLTFLMLLVLGMVLLLGTVRNGAQRWLTFGPLNVQPSEFAKLYTVLYLSHYIAGHKDRPSRFGILPLIVIVGIESTLIYLEPDLGTTVVILTLMVLLLVLGGTPWRHLLPLVAIAGIIIAAVSRVPYQVGRIRAFIESWGDMSRAHPHIQQSYIAIGQGGIMGMGAGEGRSKLYYLPEAHTDFIFSVIGEEWGLIGTLLILFLFFALLWRGIKIVRGLSDPFGQLLGLGVTLLILLSSLMHMGVVTGLLPAKGLALPFLSYGGSSLLVNWIGVGLLYNVSKQANVPKRGNVW